MEPVQQARRHLKGQRIDHEQEQAQREYRHGQSQQDQQRAHKSVQQAQHQRGDHGRAKAADLHPVVPLREQHQGRRQQ